MRLGRRAAQWLDGKGGVAGGGGLMVGARVGRARGGGSARSTTGYIPNAPSPSAFRNTRTRSAATQRCHSRHHHIHHIHHIQHRKHLNTSAHLPAPANTNFIVTAYHRHRRLHQKGNVGTRRQRRSVPSISLESTPLPLVRARPHKGHRGSHTRRPTQPCTTRAFPHPPPPPPPHTHTSAHTQADILFTLLHTQ